MEIKRIGVWHFLGMMVITTLVSFFFLNPFPVSAYTMSINTSLNASVESIAIYPGTNSKPKSDGISIRCVAN